MDPNLIALAQIIAALEKTQQEFARAIVGALVGAGALHKEDAALMMRLLASHLREIVKAEAAKTDHLDPAVLLRMASFFDQVAGDFVPHPRNQEP
jgi:hypothetical protein